MALEKMQFLCSSILQGSAETLFRWSGKINHSLIAWSLSNIGAKNCSNWKMFVQVTAKNVWEVLKTL